MLKILEFNYMIILIRLIHITFSFHFILLPCVKFDQG